MNGHPGFCITAKSGFHVTFENGWTVSVQFGPGNYCENRDMDIGHDNEAAGKRGSSSAEVAAWPAGGGLVAMPDGDTVAGWQRPADVLALFWKVAALPADATSLDAPGAAIP